jgi:hypothetical protein
MFAMLNGAWPRVAADGTPLATIEDAVALGRASSADLEAAIAAAVEAVVRAQEGAGLELVTDGSVRWADPGAALLRALDAGDTGEGGMLVRSWSATAALTDRVVAQALPGPYTLGRRAGAGDGVETDRALVLGLADRLAGELRSLEAAGCALAVIDEPDSVAVGADRRERDLFADAQRRLLSATPRLHAMLAVTGGSAWDAGAETILAAPYRSYLFDLIAGPDNWHLVRAAPGDRGIVCGALRPESRPDQAPELVWAAKNAASSNGRGPERVGLANASPMTSLTPEAAGLALVALARAAGLAALPLDEAVAEGLDPRAISQPGDPQPGRRRP